MTDDSPSAEVPRASIDGSSGGDVIESHPTSHPSAFGAPSDFLPGLPPSTDTSAISNATAEASEHDAVRKTSFKPPADAQGRTLNPRSCVTCRKRKVKCDKLWPCNNCNRAHIECVFPAPGRAPRKPRKIGDGRDKELLDRLRKLESVVKGMGADVPGGELQEENAGGQADPTLPTASPVPASRSRDAEEEFQSKTRWVEEQQRGRFENRFGRLVVNDGKSRYINNSFWASLSNEVEDLKGILNQSSGDEDDRQSVSPESGSHPPAPSNHHAFVFGFSSHNVDMLALHPLPGQIKDYWDIYKDRVDPLCKILHVPTLEGTILSAASHLANLSRGFECLLFAIYYGATTSLTGEDCLRMLGEEKAVLLARYRFAIEQALARANFLTTEEIVVLQAFVIFLICLRRNSDARVIWTLTGLVVRIAQTLGIHRDGSHFGLSPFEVEMRRRLWWQVCILDTRASEDHGCDPTIVEQSFDTKMPKNLNDEDITPDMKECPTERQGCTIMSFCLLRFEVANTFRRINYIPPGPPKACEVHLQSVTLQDKERWITECHKRLEERYLKHCDMNVPLFWVTATVARLMMSKMWLMVYHPFQRQDGGASLSEETKEKLFITSLENMEYSLLLENEARTMKWGWLFRTYIQWHALAFTLSELCHRTRGDMVERAWKAVNRTVEGRWNLQFGDETNSGHLWRPLRKLYRKARDAHTKGVQEEQRLKQEQGEVPLRHYSPNANPMFGHPSRSSVTRAPLSSAQLQRFHQGPSFGQTPLDKHEMLRSPKLDAAGQHETPGTTAISADMLDQSLNASPTTLGGGTLTGLGDMASLAAPIPQQAYSSNMALSRDLSNTSPNVKFVDVPVDHSTTVPNVSGIQEQASSDVDGRFQVGSLESFDNDLSIMDTSGNLDWENWDQLVRQFGMDVDSGNVGGSDGMDWNNTNFGTTASGEAGLKNGFGISGGQWY